MKTLTKQYVLGSEDGSVLFVALIVLLVFTMLGLSATTTSNIGLRIVGNENIYKRNLYLAEGAALESAQGLYEADLRNDPPSWVLPTVGSVADTITQPTFRSDNGQPSVLLTDASGAPLANRLAAFEGAVGSLDMTKSRVYAYSVYGWSEQDGRLVIVEIGYRKSYK
jgi:hypothetical protein